MLSFSAGEEVDDAEEEGVRRIEKTGRPMKRWQDLGPQQKRAKSQKLFDELKRTAKTRQISPVKLVGGLLRR